MRLFNELGQEVGSPQVDQYCGNGNANCEINYTMDSDHTGQQATYALFTGNDNAICIAYTTVSWPDGSNYAWSGDWASSNSCQMGQGWYVFRPSESIAFVFLVLRELKPIFRYYSNIQMQNGSSNMYTPNCIWIDANGDTGVSLKKIPSPSKHSK